MTTVLARRSTTIKVVASVALVGGALGLAFSGAFGTFTDQATGGPQTISSGKIVLAVGPTNDSATGAANIMPGDTVAREIDLNSTGATAPDASITLAVKASPSSLLDTDPTNGLQLQVQSCATAPTRTTGTTPPVSYTCSGGWTTVLASTPVATLETTPATLPGLKSLSPGGQDYLLLTLSLPASAPGNFSQVATACSGSAGGNSSTENLEGCSSTLTYLFLATQRSGSAQ